jgi:hypothetical protein
MAEDMFRQIHKANSNVDMDLTADIYKLRLQLHQEWVTAMRGRVQLAYSYNACLMIAKLGWN